MLYSDKRIPSSTGATAIYYAISDIDQMLCTAFERVNTNNSAHIDLELTNKASTKASNIVISFYIGNDIKNNIVTVAQLSKIIRTENMTNSSDEFQYESADGAFRAAMNNKSINASPFGHICK